MLQELVAGLLGKSLEVAQRRRVGHQRDAKTEHPSLASRERLCGLRPAFGEDRPAGRDAEENDALTAMRALEDLGVAVVRNERLERLRRGLQPIKELAIVEHAHQHGVLHPGALLTGQFEQSLEPVDVDGVILEIDDAIAEGLSHPSAMALATADADGRPSVRHVLLKGLDERGLEFHTNYESRKGHDLAANPYAAAVFPWFGMWRQATAVGPVTKVSAEDSDAYFYSRDRGSQIGAWASPQTQPVRSS